MEAVFVVTVIALVLLFYTYVGYPTLICLLAKIRPNPVRKRAITPSVTLIIPAYNEAKVIEEKIQNVLQLDYPREQLQIVMADDGSTDGTPEIARRFLDQGIEVLSDGQRRGKMGAINRAARIIRGEIVVFSDANVMLTPESLREVVANFADSAVGCVVARKRVIKTGSALSHSDGLYWKYEDLIQSGESKVHSTVAASGHMQAIRRNLLSQFPEDVLVLDDLYLALSVMNHGLRAIYEPAATCWESTSVSIHGEIARRRRITASRCYTIDMLRKRFRHLPPQLIFQLISHKVLRLFIPFYMLIALLGNLILVFSPRWLGHQHPILWHGLASLLAVQIVFYWVGLLGAGMERLGRKLPKLVYLPYFLCRTNLASLTGLMWFLLNTGSSMWQRVERE